MIGSRRRQFAVIAGAIGAALVASGILLARGSGVREAIGLVALGQGSGLLVAGDRRLITTRADLERRRNRRELRSPQAS